MIPKIIHYCWFGRNPLPDSAIKCIESWQKFFPGYEIKEWNEDNFDVNEIPYTEEAYKKKKYAFVSDYARFKILYELGGIYFDTDVEVIKSFKDVVSNGPFMGFEIAPCKDSRYRKYDFIAINPGLGLGAYSGMPLYKEIIDYYSKIPFTKDGIMIQTTVCEHTTKIFLNHGLKETHEIQKVCDINIYPPDWFNPLDDTIGKLYLTENTHSIHWYAKTWIKESNFRRNLSRISHRILGHKFIPIIKKRITKIINR